MTEGFSGIIAQLERQKEAIDRALTALREVEGIGAPRLGSGTSTSTHEAPSRKGKKRSAAVRQKMKEAQQLRWAKRRGEAAPSAKPEAPKAKRRISPEGMKRIIAATKKRWALKRAEDKAASKPTKAAVKKSAKASAPALLLPAAK